METSTWKRITRLEEAVAAILDYLSHPGEPIGPEAAVERFEVLKSKLEPLLKDVEER